MSPKRRRAEGEAESLPSSEALVPLILSDLQVEVLQFDPDLQMVAPGRSGPLTDLFPELISAEDSLQEVARGLAPRFDLPMINRFDPGEQRQRYLSLAALPHPEIEGRAVLLVRDVTREGHLGQQIMQQLNEVRLLRAQLERANRQLARLNEEKSGFVQMAAHDLRAPLTVIKGYVEAVLDDLAPVAGNLGDVVEYLRVVLRRAQLMRELIDALLDVERIESGQVVLERVPMDLGRLAADVGQIQAPLAQKQGLALTWEAGGDLPTVPADPRQMRQVLNNLVGNAIKFTPAGGRVWIEVFRREAALVVEVHDTGPGISEADQAHLFQRFFRADSVRGLKIPGTGLGLPIARAIIEQHGGQIYCRSQIGEGSTFGFTLPLEEL